MAEILCIQFTKRPVHHFDQLDNFRTERVWSGCSKFHQGLPYNPLGGEKIGEPGVSLAGPKPLWRHDPSSKGKIPRLYS